MPSLTKALLPAVLILAMAAIILVAASPQSAPPGPKTSGPETSGPETSGPSYTADGHLKMPKNYRQWVYLTTGFDMSYNPALSMGHHMFDNVFVDPASYKAFRETGTWPDKTTLVLEQRMGRTGSINKAGNYQDTDIMGLEVHVKDASRFPGKWAFFGFDNEETGDLFPPGAECYKCHSAHAAVDTTFVQFYPTLLPISKAKNTLSAGYLAESAAESSKEPAKENGGAKK